MTAALEAYCLFWGERPCAIDYEIDALERRYSYLSKDEICKLVNECDFATIFDVNDVAIFVMVDSPSGKYVIVAVAYKQEARRDGNA